MLWFTVTPNFSEEAAMSHYDQLNHFIHRHMTGISFSVATTIIAAAAVAQQLGITEASPSFWAFVVAHEVVFSIAGVAIFVAGATAMTPPGVDGGGFYGWAYRFTRALMPIAESLIEHRAPHITVVEEVSTHRDRRGE
jgi:hypothetical protein